MTISDETRMKISRAGRGERNSSAKLTEKNVEAILYYSHVSAKELANMFGVSVHCIKDIRSGRTWKHVKR